MKRIMIFLVVVMGFTLSIPAQAATYTGHHWNFANPTYVPVTIKSNVPSAWNTAIARSMSSWNGANAKFRFIAGSADHTVAYGNVWFAPDALAITYIREWWGTRITDRDTDISSRYSWDVNGAYNTYDIQNVMTHEFGHWIELDDLYGSADYWRTMYYASQTGETYKRSLDPDEIGAIRIIYGHY